MLNAHFLTVYKAHVNKGKLKNSRKLEKESNKQDRILKRNGIELFQGVLRACFEIFSGFTADALYHLDRYVHLSKVLCFVLLSEIVQIQVLANA